MSQVNKSHLVLINDRLLSLLTKKPFCPNSCSLTLSSNQRNDVKVKISTKNTLSRLLVRNIPHKNFLQKVRKTVLRLNVAIFFADSKLSPPLNYLKNCLANKTTSWNVRRNQFPMSNCGPIWAKLSNIKAKVEMLIKLPIKNPLVSIM